MPRLGPNFLLSHCHALKLLCLGISSLFCVKPRWIQRAAAEMMKEPGRAFSGEGALWHAHLRRAALPTSRRALGLRPASSLGLGFEVRTPPDSPPPTPVPFLWCCTGSLAFSPFSLPI